MSEIWACGQDTAAAVTETQGMSREALVARLMYLAPALTDDGLRAVVVAAMTAPQRSLDAGVLAEEQRQREAATA